MKLVLNETTIKTLGAGTYQDAKQRGLVLKITPTSKRLSFYGWLNGEPHKKSIGRWPDMSITVARQIAAQILVEKPKDRKRLSYIVEKYVARCKLRQHRTDYMTEIADLYWDDFKKKSLEAITTAELQDRHDEIVKKRGPQAGRRAVLGMRTLFNHAIRLQLTERNPALGVETAGKTVRDVFLTRDEVGAMRKCLDEMGLNARHFFLIALLTGIRRRNITGMLWDWVDMEGEFVTIPAAHSKNKKEMVIPLVPEVMTILRQRYAARVDGKVFATTDVLRWIIDLRRRMREAGVTKEFRVHDMRRTRATHMLGAGVSLPLISAVLGHVNMKSTTPYLQTDTEMKRAALLQSLV